MDAFMCSLQSALAKSTALRFRPLSVRLGMAGPTRIEQTRAARGAVVAKIIEFYIPNSFRRNEKWIPPQNRGKILEFRLQTRKSA